MKKATNYKHMIGKNKGKYYVPDLKIEKTKSYFFKFHRRKIHSVEKLEKQIANVTDRIIKNHNHKGQSGQIQFVEEHEDNIIKDMVTLVISFKE